eukprot:3439302-Amphidinium_carterae.1
MSASTTTIEITSGTNDGTSRIDLKKAMSAYGEVDVCHMGARGVDLPFVRFRTTEGAEAALEALKKGDVSLPDGSVLGGDWKAVSRKQEGGA